MEGFELGQEVTLRLFKAGDVVDVIGLSILSGAHLGLTRKIIKGLKEKGLEDKLVIVGGTIPDEDHSKLKEIGVAAVFPTGTPLSEPVEFVKNHLKRKED